MTEKGPTMEDFLCSSELKGDCRSVGVYEPLHEFYKDVSAFYGIKMTDLVSNVLMNWMDHFKDDYMVDRMKRMRERGY